MIVLVRIIFSENIVNRIVYQLLRPCFEFALSHRRIKTIFYRNNKILALLKILDLINN